MSGHHHDDDWFIDYLGWKHSDDLPFSWGWLLLILLLYIIL